MAASGSTGRQEPDTPFNCLEEPLPLILSFEIIPAFTIVHSDPVSIVHTQHHLRIKLSWGDLRRLENRLH